MNIEIKIEKNVVSIFLKNKNNMQDQVVFPEERNLAEKLLPSVDNLLKKNKLGPEDIGRMELQADMDDSYTTFRIAKAVVDSFNWTRKIHQAVDNSGIRKNLQYIKKDAKTIKRLK
ncbi:MAG TPA: hypothetical protein VF390_01565 [Patescibacteria group bacterium]